MGLKLFNIFLINVQPEKKYIIKDKSITVLLRTNLTKANHQKNSDIEKPKQMTESVQFSVKALWKRSEVMEKSSKVKRRDSESFVFKLNSNTQ